MVPLTDPSNDPHLDGQENYTTKWGLYDPQTDGPITVPVTDTPVMIPT